MSTVVNDLDQRVSPRGSGGRGGSLDDEHRRTVRRRVLWAVGGVLIIVLLLTGVVFGMTLQVANQATRIPNAFAGLNAAARPAPGAGQTFLLVGRDSAAPGETIMLATVARDGSHASLVAIPREAVAAAYSPSAPSQLVGAVEQVTRVRVDHLAVLDFAGFGQLTDAVGGINVNVAAPTGNDGVAFVAGGQHLDGAQALAYVRQRTGLPGGEADHARRQQNAMRALVNSAVSSGATSNPFLAYDLADGFTRWASVDDTMSNGDLLSLGRQMRDLRTRSIDFVTAPVPAAGQDLWAAVGADAVSGYVKSHPGSALPISPR